MREIKFRGKRVDGGEWEYGYYIQWQTRQCCPINDDLSEDEIVHLIAKDGFADWNMPISLEFVKVIPETVGQYVEILDAYQGDLLYGCETDEYNMICSSWIGEVKFNDDKGRLMVLDNDVDEWFEVDDFMFDKIISNIHEVK